ncbi:aminotransferase class V-fold PLP-dependent enzyme [Candidatus Woesearchaeota archaeon]|nr:aminotransferase class V-fold PLP-dependent enzyme [Candidatus Woesearchaeota archaeon]
MMGFNVEKIRNDFSVLQKNLKGKPIIYFDNACQSLRPNQVIDKILQYYKEFPSCGERSLHKLGKQVDKEIDESRKTIRKFFNAKSNKEIIFTKNTTEALNLVINGLGMKQGDTVISSDKEHNSNLLPLQFLSKRGINHKWFEFGNIDDFQEKLDKNTKLVSVVHVSNMDGTVNPVKEIIKIAHDNGSLVLLDGAQSAPHKEINVKKLDCDFFAASGHKMLGPSGTGVLVGKEKALEQLNPLIVGGSTVDETTYTTYNFEELPMKLEAGLQNYAGIMGLGEAARYLSKTGLKNIEKHEQKLNTLATEALKDKVEILGPVDAEKRSGIFSFNIKKMTPHDIAMILDQSANIMMRSGAHCDHSWFNAHGMNGSARASFYLYNTEEEVNKFIEEINKIKKHLT